MSRVFRRLKRSQEWKMTRKSSQESSGVGKGCKELSRDLSGSLELGKVVRSYQGISQDL
jgi:hypothetical protein